MAQLAQTMYSLSNTVRSVQDIFNTMITSRGEVLSLFHNGPAPTNTKHEWFDLQLAPTTYAITSFSTDGDGTGLVFSGLTTGMSAGDIIIWQDATGDNITERVQIASVTNTTTIVVVRDFGSSTGVTLAVGDVGTLIKTAKEGQLKTALTSTAATEPTAVYNYTQILNRLVTISRSMIATNEYGVDALTGNAAMKMENQLSQMLTELEWELRNSIFMGVKYVGSATAARMMGGLDQIIRAGGNINTTGGAVTLDLLNDTAQLVRDDGGELPSVLLMHSAQKRMFANLNTSGTNPLVTVNSADITAGSLVDVIRNDVAGISKIVIDDLMPKDVIYFLNPDYLELNWMLPLGKINATAPGDDAVSEILRGEVTASIRNAKAMAIATGLSH